jgi:glycosyltransferase involved in cell wall biosynthesis
MVKVLCLVDSLGPGGAQRQLVGLAIFLKEKGYDVIVACYHDNRFYVDSLLTKGVPYVYLKKAHNSTIRMWHVARYIRKVKPDVVISYLETPSICACVAHLFNRRFKLIVSERNTTQHTGRNEKIRFNLFRLADCVVPNAFAQETYINDFFPFLTKKIVTIPNFVDLNHFVPVMEKLPHEVPEIVVAASIWKSKNTLGFLDAVSELKKQGFSFHVSWYGKVTSHMDYFEQCQQKIKELGINDCIELQEKTQYIREKYQGADYFCLPSFYEGTPNVICEAMACGLPIACSNVCDNSIYVREGENGFMFDPHNIESIVEALRRLLSLQGVDYQSFCLNSRKLAKALLSEEKFVNSYIKLIEQ